MKKILRFTAAAAAAAMLAGTMATAAYAANSEKEKAEKKASYTTPMTTDRSSAAYKKFTSSKPEGLSSSSGWYSGIEWNKVDNAMLYYVYKKVNGKLTLIGKTCDTFFYFEDIIYSAQFFRSKHKFII